MKDCTNEEIFAVTLVNKLNLHLGADAKIKLGVCTVINLKTKQNKTIDRKFGNSFLYRHRTKNKCDVELRDKLPGKQVHAMLIGSDIMVTFIGDVDVIFQLNLTFFNRMVWVHSFSF